MSALPKTHLTPEEYLEMEDDAQERSEFHDGEVFAMAGESEAHSLLCARLTTFFTLRLLGRACAAYAPNMKVWIERDRRFFYPDLAALCGPAQFRDERRNALTNPAFIAEVLSPSTEAFDRGAKFHHYLTLPSLREYVLVSQWEVAVERYERCPDGVWRYEHLAGPQAVLRSAALGCEIPLGELYAGIELAQRQPPRKRPEER
jgi:Uma2 family endonuclease